MGLWLSLTIALNVLSAILILVVFALMKRQSALRQDILRIQKEWIQWRALGAPSLAAPDATAANSTHHASSLNETAPSGNYVSEHHVSEPALGSLETPVYQSVRSRSAIGDDWKSSASGSGGSWLREKAAKSLRSETVGESGDRFGKARELLRQGHGMKEVAVVTGLSYSELALISKTDF